MRPRQFYADFVCGLCGKLDEAYLLGTTIPAQQLLKRAFDWVTYAARLSRFGPLTGAKVRKLSRSNGNYVN